MNSEFQYVQETAVSQQVPLVDEVLERQLVDAVGDPRLEVEDVVAVLERFRRVAVGESTRQLIERGEAKPDRELQPEI